MKATISITRLELLQIVAKHVKETTGFELTGLQVNGKDQYDFNINRQPEIEMSIGHNAQVSYRQAEVTFTTVEGKLYP